MDDVPISFGNSNAFLYVRRTARCTGCGPAGFPSPGAGGDRTGRFALAALCMPLHHAQSRNGPSLDSAASRAVLPASRMSLPVLGQGPTLLCFPRAIRALYDLATPVGDHFTQCGGNVGYPPLAEWAWPILRNFYLGVGGPRFENDISAFCLNHRVSSILVGPGTPAPLAAAVEALHWQEVQNPGIRVVRVPDPLRLRTKAEEK